MREFIDISCTRLQKELKSQKNLLTTFIFNTRKII